MTVPGVDPAQFRQLMGHFATGVTIITAVDPSGEPAGMTANSLASASLQPPLVSVCVDRSADMHRALELADRFAFNILRADQEALSRRFAAPEQSRFDGIGYRRTEAGFILLDGVMAYLECERYAAYPAGDHSIYVGRVIGGSTERRGAAALLPRRLRRAGPAVSSLTAPPPGTELLDDPAADPEVVRRSLGDIARSNRWFGGAAAVRFALERILDAVVPGTTLSLIDIGTGLGDLPRSAARWGAARGIPAAAGGLRSTSCRRPLRRRPRPAHGGRQRRPPCHSAIARWISCW